MSNSINGAQVASKAGNVRRENESKNQQSTNSIKRESARAVVEASRNVKSVFGVEYSTIARRIREAKKGERPIGVVAHGKFRVPGEPNHINIYVEVNDEDGHYDVTVTAYKSGWKQRGLQTQKMTVDYERYSKQQEAFEQALGSAMVKYISAWYDMVKANEEANVEPVEEPVEETANVEENSAADTLEQALAQSLDDAGNNALNLAYALAEAIEHTEGAVTTDNIEEQALWRAYRAEIENRLASLSRGGDTPAPCLEEKPAETPNDNSGTPTPCLRDQIAEKLAADWAQMGDSPLEGYIGEHHMGGGYLLETTRELWQDPFMGVRLVRLGDDHEHFWRIYRDGDIPGVADQLSRAMHANE